MDDKKRGAKPPTLAKLELVTRPRDLCPVSAGIVIKPGLNKADSTRVIVEPVVKAEPEIDLVVQVLAVNAFAVGMVRESVDVQIKRESGICR